MFRSINNPEEFRSNVCEKINNMFKISDVYKKMVEKNKVLDLILKKVFIIGQLNNQKKNILSVNGIINIL